MGASASSVVPSQDSRQYSVEFFDGMGVKQSCDWRWPYDLPAWTMGSRDEYEVRWYPDGPLTEEGRRVLIKEFKLESIAGQLPLETISRMSPSELFAKRHELEEADHNLPHIHPVSYRVGGHIPPEMAT